MEKTARIRTEDGSHSLFVPGMNETYHSRSGALTESAYVYIAKGLDELVRHGHRHIRIFEMGFGTGLNVLLSLQYTLDHPGIRVTYHSIELFPLEKELWETLNYPDLLPSHPGDFFRMIHESPWNTDTDLTDRFRLQKIHADFLTWEPDTDYLLVYYDAFAPSRQEALWEEALLQKTCNLMKPGALLVTYCAQGRFRRCLKAAGLHVETLPGPPGKKEMTRAEKAGSDGHLAQ